MPPSDHSDLSDDESYNGSVHNTSEDDAPSLYLANGTIVAAGTWELLCDGKLIECEDDGDNVNVKLSDTAVARINEPKTALYRALKFGDDAYHIIEPVTERELVNAAIKRKEVKGRARWQAWLKMSKSAKTEFKKVFKEWELELFGPHCCLSASLADMLKSDKSKAPAKVDEPTEEPVPEKASPEKAVPEKAAPEKIAPEKAVSEKTAPEKVDITKSAESPKKRKPEPVPPPQPEKRPKQDVCADITITLRGVPFSTISDLLK